MDTKSVKIIKTKRDVIDLQHDIDNSQMWCNQNHLYLSINKCKFMQYYQIKNPKNYQYYISDFKIELVTNFKDLEMVFDTKLNSSIHTEMMENVEFRFHQMYL